jgi:hypothetical protein
MSMMNIPRQGLHGLDRVYQCRTELGASNGGEVESGVEEGKGVQMVLKPQFVSRNFVSVGLSSLGASFMTSSGI